MDLSLLMKVKKLLLFFGFLLISISSFILPGYFLPADVLNNLPSFSIDNWERPKNSLLADPVYQFEPWRHYAKERITHGQFPLWNDKNGNGAPFFANPQTAVLYPLNFFYYFLPEKIALYFIPLLKLYFFGVFSYLYLKSLKILDELSIIGSFALVFSGFSILWLLWPHTNVYVLFPLILYATEKVGEVGKNNKRWFFLISFSYFFAILGGHPETLFNLTFLHIIYTLFKFWSRRKFLLYVFTGIFFGFLLGSIQIIPFLEYLLKSYALEQRPVVSLTYFLPIKSFISNIFPLFLGAPHIDYYKPFSVITNFNETTGGYVGFALFLSALIGFLKLRKISIFKIWTFIVLFSWFLSYKIWPFSFVAILPLFNNNANHRFIGFSGFGIIVLAILFLNKILLSKSETKNIKLSKILLITGIIISCIYVFSKLILYKFYFNYPEKIFSFFNFLNFHIFFILISTIFFFLFLFWINNYFKNRKFFLILLIPIFLQTAFLFWNYNPVISKDNYYPKTKLIEKLNSIPKGNILEIGNPSLPANVNLKYGIFHAENNDAMEIADYKKAFDKSFIFKNYWKNIDALKLSDAQNFGIRYIISDYDLNLNSQKVQKEYSLISKPIIKSDSLKIDFKPRKEDLKQIRIFTANFNRSNNCVLYFKIIDKISKEKISEESVNCKDIRNYMFYSASFNVKLDKNREYTLIINSNGKINNSVALLGSSQRNPYLELLYEEKEKNNEYKLIFKEKNISLWEIPFNYIEGMKSYSIISQTPEKILFEGEIQGEIKIKKVYYPGWTVFIDGKEVQIRNNNSFISFDAPKGKHTVIIEYFPRSFYIGIILTLVSFLLFLVYSMKKEKQKIFCNFYKFYRLFVIFQKLILNLLRPWNIVMIFILALSFFLNFYKISNLMTFMGDQGWFYLAARDFIITGNIPLVGITASHTWLHQGALWTYILGFIFKLAGFNPIFPGYFTAFFGVITVWLIYMVSSNMFSKRVGIISALLYSTSPLVIDHMRMPYHTSLIPFFTLLFILFLFKWLKGNLVFFPFIFAFLGILYNFELATVSLWFMPIFLIGYGFFAKKNFIKGIYQKKVIFLSVISFLIPMLPIFIYDFSHGFSQTLKFIVWIVYRVVSFFWHESSFSISNFSSIFSFLAFSYQNLIFLSNSIISFIIFILTFVLFIFILYFNFLKRKIVNISYLILFLWIIISIVGLIINKTPSEAYLSIIFPSIIILNALFFDYVFKFQKFKLIIIVLLLSIAGLNSLSFIDKINNLENNNGYIFKYRLNIAREIVDKSEGKAYNLVGKGNGSQFKSFTMNYEYLTWWLGNAPSKKKENKYFIIREDKQGIRLSKE